MKNDRAQREQVDGSSWRRRRGGEKVEVQMVAMRVHVDVKDGNGEVRCRPG